MAKKFLTDLDMTKNEVKNAVIQRLSASPASPVEGQVYYDTTLHQFGVRTNSTWVYLGSAGAVSSVFGRIGAVVAVAGDYIASQITFTPASGISATNVQSAIEEVKTYASNLLLANDAMVFKGSIDASGNPNYPAGNAGDTYKISVAGKIGGGSGINVQVGDTIICNVDSSSTGNHATVGANWTVLQTNLEYASQAEAEAKSDNSKVVTPNALANFGVKKSFTIGDGSTTAITVTHNLGSKDVVCSVREVSTDTEVDCEIEHSSPSETEFTFTTPPATNAIRVVIIG